MLYKEIHACRICGNKKLIMVLDLGTMALTGVFPKIGETTESGPIEMVKCDDTQNKKFCGLLQLKHNYDLTKLYGDNYGYRSGLNQSMVEHLKGIVASIKKQVKLKKGDLIVDIGSNDGTLLHSYNDTSLQLVGIDPTIKKFVQYYDSHIKCIPDFFSEKVIRKHSKLNAKVVTSIAMFYDLEKPIAFMQEIYNILADDGIWVFEQSYMPHMIDNVSYDTICHEHLEYYSLKQILWMTKKVGFKIVDVEINNANGASFRITVAKEKAPYKKATKKIDTILADEASRGLDNLDTYKQFAKSVRDHKKQLIAFIRQAKAEGKKILGYGASTKGSVILQYCNLTKDDIPYIAEVNEYKFGRLAPGTNIPIISEKEAKKHAPHYLMVLPWHFKKNIVSREQEYLTSGGCLFFPLPKLELVK